MTPEVMTAAPAASTIVMPAIIWKALVIQNRDTKRELAITNRKMWTMVSVLPMKPQTWTSYPVYVVI